MSSPRAAKLPFATSLVSDQPLFLPLPALVELDGKPFRIHGHEAPFRAQPIQQIITIALVPLDILHARRSEHFDDLLPPKPLQTATGDQVVGHAESGEV